MTDENTTWAIGDHVVEAVAAPQPTLARGEQLTLTVAWHRRGTLHEDDTLHDDGTVHGDYHGQYRALREFLAYPDRVRVWVSDTGVPAFRERLPDAGRYDTHVVRVEPGEGIDDAEPFWAAIVGGSDASTVPARRRELDLEMVVLGTVEEFEDEGELREALEEPVIG